MSLTTLCIEEFAVMSTPQKSLVMDTLDRKALRS